MANGGLEASFKWFADRSAKVVSSAWFFAVNCVLCVAGYFLPSQYDRLTYILSVVTWLVAILIQHTQTRDTTALQAKLDELIRVNDRARNSLIGSEKH